MVHQHQRQADEQMDDLHSITAFVRALRAMRGKNYCQILR